MSEPIRNSAGTSPVSRKTSDVKNKFWKLGIASGAGLVIVGTVMVFFLLPNIIGQDTPPSATESPESIDSVNNKQQGFKAFPPSPSETVVSLGALAEPIGYISGDPTGDPDRISQLIKLSNGESCHTGADCIKITYRSGGVFGGIFWWPPQCGEYGTPEAWELVKAGNPPCAVSVIQAGNFRRPVQRLTFWAKGSQGNEVVEFKVGAPSVWPRPGRSSGKVTLTRDWQPYRIELGAVDMTRITVPFAWVASDLNNPNGAVFYLDDIQFESSRDG
ncbi:MAG: hypothetical protein AB4290_04700 [Spirulina sp.]